jgi:mRNA interferase MazF
VRCGYSTLGWRRRPVLVVSVTYGDADRAIVTVVPHTTQLRGSPFEISVHAPFLQPGAFLVQGISTYPKAWAIRKIGALTRDEITTVMMGFRNWLGLTQG